eukprot:TRINITY_DN4866_c0_g1_i2.p1 TRINITY_DN4866_c0_g1~~TRINITY_DN4866_c0_g1_i2.p1  ORF type:complete len:203 (+),score=36.95 TRINITY_DN4866_c0_g1_i2:55-663(+)
MSTTHSLGHCLFFCRKEISQYDCVSITTPDPSNDLPNIRMILFNEETPIKAVFPFAIGDEECFMYTHTMDPWGDADYYYVVCLFGGDYFHMIKGDVDIYLDDFFVDYLFPYEDLDFEVINPVLDACVQSSLAYMVDFVKEHVVLFENMLVHIFMGYDVQYQGNVPNADRIIQFIRRSIYGEQQMVWHDVLDLVFVCFLSKSG